MGNIDTLSHEIFELSLQLDVLVVGATYDSMLEGAANIHMRHPSHPLPYMHAQSFGTHFS
jgi:hypothetical protein